MSSTGCTERAGEPGRRRSRATGVASRATSRSARSSAGGSTCAFSSSTASRRRATSASAPRVSSPTGRPDAIRASTISLSATSCWPTRSARRSTRARASSGSCAGTSRTSSGTRATIPGSRHARFRAARWARCRSPARPPRGHSSPTSGGSDWPGCCADGGRHHLGSRALTLVVTSHAREADAMGFLRDRQRGDDESAAAPPGVYQMREKMLSIGDDFWIENGAGERVFKVDGKAMRVRKTLSFEDLDGHELVKIQERKLRVRDTMAIERGGDTVATVRKAMVSPLRERFKVDLDGGREYHVKGNIVDHEYEFERDGREVATVSKRWFRLRDTYGVEVATGEDDVLVLAITVALDQMTHDRD